MEVPFLSFYPKKYPLFKLPGEAVRKHTIKSNELSGEITISLIAKINADSYRISFIFERKR